MTRDNINKLNFMLRRAPRGAVLSSRWLSAHDISSKLAWWYVKSGWLERLSDGAYKLAGDSVSWEGVVHALQQQYELHVHVGGKTALQLLGKLHYLSADFTSQSIQLFSPQGAKLPRWVKVDAFEEKFILYASKLFLDPPKQLSGLVTKQFNSLEVQLSAPERAILEACHLVGRALSFEEVALLVESLSRLRPRIVQGLLESCQSIKAKRLFLYLSEFYQHPWLSDLTFEKIELGKGKYTIANGGVFDAKYKIAIPKLREV